MVYMVSWCVPFISSTHTHKYDGPSAHYFLLKKKGFDILVFCSQNSVWFASSLPGNGRVHFPRLQFFTRLL